MWAFLTLKAILILFLIMMSHFEVACDSGRRCCDDLHHWAVLGHCRLLYSGTYWERAGQLLANLFSLFLVPFPEVVTKVNSSQFPSRIYKGVRETRS